MFDAGSLVPIAFLLSVTFILLGITKVLSDGTTRRRLIAAGAAPDLARVIVAAPRDDPGLYSALRWGLLTGAIGLALILVQFLPYRSNEPIVLGMILVFAAGGQLGYYVAELAPRCEHEDHTEHDRLVGAIGQKLYQDEG